MDNNSTVRGIMTGSFLHHIYINLYRYGIYKPALWEVLFLTWRGVNENCGEIIAEREGGRHVVSNYC